MNNYSPISETEAERKQRVNPVSVVLHECPRANNI